LEKQQQANKLNRTIRRSNSFNSINTHLYQQPLTTYQQQPVVKSRFLTNSGANFQVIIEYGLKIYAQLTIIFLV